MPSALSVDLRERVVAAIEAGASRRQAAKRFGIGAASAIRWHERYRQDGQIAPKPMGGDRNSQRLEAPGGPHPSDLRRASAILPA